MTLTIVIDPAEALIDVERRIVVSGAAPDRPVEIACVSRRSDGSVWETGATFLADDRGCVDVATTAPVSGGYEGVSAMGLIWAQRQTAPAQKTAGAPGQAVEPVVNAITARSGSETAAADLVQHYAGEGVTRRDIREAGLSGTLFLPKGDGPHPAVMIMNGSGGGINEPRAALYASRGYAAFALGYFRAPGRPDYISDMPLEYFRDGLRWLRRTVRPLKDFVAVTGQSRGGELVLLLGATFPEEVDAVLAYVPAAYVHSGQSASDPARGGRNGHVWTLDGTPLPHLLDHNRTATWEPYDRAPEPRRHEYALLTFLADRDAVARARIPVEKIRAPVLLVNGTDDGWWPTDYHCDVVEETLREAGHAWPVRRIRCEGAGHMILFPYTPATRIAEPHPVSGILSTNGGAAPANAVANERAWSGALEFLAEAVAAKPAPAETGHAGR